MSWKRVTHDRREQAMFWLKNEVKAYDQYLTGDVYGLIVEDHHGEELDSCWGYFGLEDSRESLKEMAEGNMPPQQELPGFGGEVQT